MAEANEILTDLRGRGVLFGLGAEVSLADLAEEYSVGRTTIHRVIHRAPAANAVELTAPD